MKKINLKVQYAIFLTSLVVMGLQAGLGYTAQGKVSDATAKANLDFALGQMQSEIDEIEKVHKQLDFSFEQVIGITANIQQKMPGHTHEYQLIKNWGGLYPLSTVIVPVQERIEEAQSVKGSMVSDRIDYVKYQDLGEYATKGFFLKKFYVGDDPVITEYIEEQKRLNPGYDYKNDAVMIKLTSKPIFK